jgi:hypothetical protein
MEDRNDQELKRALATGELSPRKQAVAKEILRRRHEAKGGWRRLGTYVWVPLLALLGVARLALRRFRGRERISHGQFP